MRNVENKAGETADSGLTSGSILFKLKCIGNTSLKNVYGTAVMSCGPKNNPDVHIAPTIIAPVVIEV